jgi:uncharacterized protein YbjT (DUF2867 family)
MILVIGASGQNGRAVLNELLARGHGAETIATSRRPNAFDGLGIPTAAFDWQRAETYAPCVAGVDQLYLIAPEGMPGMPERARLLVEEAVAAGVRHIVFLSAIGVQHRADLPLRQVELAVAELADTWTVLRANWFMQNFSNGLFRAGIVDRDEIAAPAGDAAISFIDVRDIAAAAAAVLTHDLDTEGRRTYTLTGATALTFPEVADLIGNATGRPVHYRCLDPDDPELLARMGLPGRRVEPVRALFDRVRSGLEAPVSTDFTKLTGRTPTDFADFAAAHSSIWATDGQ